jgi:hypothetical protein
MSLGVTLARSLARSFARSLGSRSLNYSLASNTVTRRVPSHPLRDH